MSIDRCANAWLEERDLVLVGNQSLPEVVVATREVAAFTAKRAVVPPRITTEQLVAACARQDYFHELAGQSGHVEVRVALSNSQVLEVPDQFGHDRFHV